MILSESRFLKSFYSESDSNLKEQRKSLMTDKENRVDLVIEEKLIHDCSKEAVKLGINLDEFHKILRPIVKYCTKVRCYELHYIEYKLYCIIHTL